eukprot:3517289-Lingulodinium_polyedra.AAC.1
MVFHGSVAKPANSSSVLAYFAVAGRRRGGGLRAAFYVHCDVHVHVHVHVHARAHLHVHAHAHAHVHVHAH